MCRSVLCVGYCGGCRMPESIVIVAVARYSHISLYWSPITQQKYTDIAEHRCIECLGLVRLRFAHWKFDRYSLKPVLRDVTVQVNSVDIQDLTGLVFGCQIEHSRRGLTLDIVSCMTGHVNVRQYRSARTASGSKSATRWSVRVALVCSCS